MAFIMSWLDSYGLNSKAIVTGVIIILAVVIIVLCVKKLLSVAIGFAAFFIVVPLLFTLFFGDGRDIVDKTSEYLAPEVAERVEQGYEYFKEQEEPLLNHDKIRETVDHIVDQFTHDRWEVKNTEKDESSG